MYWIAQAVAIQKGPTTIIFAGKKYAAYALSRREVEAIFEDNHYNLSRSTWRRAMKDWQRYGALISERAFDKTYFGDWTVMFDNIDKKNFDVLDHYYTEFKESQSLSEMYPIIAEGAAL